MKTIIFLKFLVLVIGWVKHAYGSESFDQLYERVRTYLQHADNKEQAMTRVTREGLLWLQNSNKIGLGYHPIVGSPVCFTGDCQMEGFRRPIFKLTYNSVSQGSCTSKLIPDNVDLDCLPSSLSSANTEEISTLEQLKESTSNGISVSASFQGWSFLSALSFSYGYSKETTHMVDNIVKKGHTMFFTTTKVSFAKLSMFEPTMPLSDQFVYVIENMPCCTYNSSVQKYINDFIFDYFGFAYITEIMLGGMGQDLVSMQKSDATMLENNQVNTKHEAKVGFYIQMGTTISSGYDVTKQQQFQRKVQSERSTRLGGDPSIKNLDEWSKTVSSNPVVTKFGIRHIFDLLTTRRFPNTHIHEKVQLVEKTLNDLATRPVFCHNKCTSSKHGKCVSSSFFNVGICDCNPGFFGFDCSEREVLQGTLCGFHKMNQPEPQYQYIIKCDGYDPLQGCPPGYIQWRSGQSKYAVCSKAVTDRRKGLVGTVCGHHGGGCGGLFGRCPEGYEYEKNSNSCYKTDASASDAAGTSCGELTYWGGPSCDGYTNGCPSGYTARCGYDPEGIQACKSLYGCSRND